MSIEDGFRPEVLAALKARGHILKSRSSFGTCQAIAFDQGSAVLTAVSEPRSGGAAAAMK